MRGVASSAAPVLHSPAVGAPYARERDTITPEYRSRRTCTNEFTGHGRYSIIIVRPSRYDIALCDGTIRSVATLAASFVQGRASPR